MKNKMYLLFIAVVVLIAFGVYQAEVFHFKAIKQQSIPEQEK